MTVDLLVEVSGWIGALLILGAYFLVSTHRVAAGSSAYQWMNLVGGVGLTVNSLWYRTYPLVAVNGIWALIALAALMRTARAPRGPDGTPTG